MNKNRYFLLPVTTLLFCTACLLSEVTFGCRNNISSAGNNKIVSSNPFVKWTLKTNDTKLCIGIGLDQNLYIYELKNPSSAWNWIPTPSSFPLVRRIDADGVQYTPNWVYKSCNISRKEGTELTLIFKNENPALELRTVWNAHKGAGPVHLSIFIKNNSGKTVTLYEQESFDLHVNCPDDNSRIVYVSDDRSLPDEKGIYEVPFTKTYANTLKISEDQDWIPYLGMETQNKGGMYLGWEWSIGRMSLKADGPDCANIKIGNRDDFKTDLYAGETFTVPPGFIGTYAGDLDDGGNSLRKYLFNYLLPSFLRKDQSYPKTEWNAFAATGKKLGGWDPVEKKYYPFIDDITPLGFEEVVIDIGWWSSYGKPKPGHIITDSTDWPSGMDSAAKYAHERGLLFGLYDNQPELLTSENGKKERIAEISYLTNNLKADFYRSDATAGPVINGTYGKGQRAHYREDADYWATSGFYEVLDSMYRKDPAFQWENCSCGGGIKDYGALKYAAKIQNQDTYFPINARRSFYDSSFILHPIQLACVIGSSGAGQLTGSVYEFRSSSMGAPYWHPDAPNGGNGGPVWTNSHKEEIKKSVLTYKEKIRPLIRYANLYHIFPRPDDVVWDGIEYYDPHQKKGAVYIFKPNSTVNSQQIKLKGLNPEYKYKITFEDGTNPSTVLTGAALMNAGINVVLNGKYISELMFFEKK